jgi:hypothetical protein
MLEATFKFIDRAPSSAGDRVIIDKAPRLGAYFTNSRLGTDSANADAPIKDMTKPTNLSFMILEPPSQIQLKSKNQQGKG